MQRYEFHPKVKAKNGYFHPKVKAKNSCFHPKVKAKNGYFHPKVKAKNGCFHPGTFTFIKIYRISRTTSRANLTPLDRVFKIRIFFLHDFC